jgi:hypothetical protein
MPLAQLAAVPKTNADLQAWQFANVANHRDIIRLTLATRGVDLTEYALQPFDPNNKASFDAFLELHQQMHTAMDSALGLPSYALNELDWNEPNQLAQWVQTHYNEHQAASSLLGVS